MIVEDATVGFERDFGAGPAFHEIPHLRIYTLPTSAGKVLNGQQTHGPNARTRQGSFARVQTLAPGSFTSIGISGYSSNASESRRARDAFMVASGASSGHTRCQNGGVPWR